jgi:capsular polysaccharide biosynthesis protein
LVVNDTVITFPFYRFYPAETHLNGSFSLAQKKAYKQNIHYPVAFNKKGVWITQNWTWMYFHWMIDALTRYVASQSFIDKHPVLLPSSYQKFSYIQESLDYLGIPYVWYDENKTTYVWELLLPSHTAIPGNYNVGYLNALRTLFLSKPRQIENFKRKVYISRKNAKTRRMINESSFIHLLAKYSIEYHCLESFSLSEKINLLSNTSLLIGVHGAGLTNMLFLPDQASVIEIRMLGDSHNNSYFAMASALKFPYYYLEAELVDSSSEEKDIVLDLEKMERILIDLKDEYSH